MEPTEQTTEAQPVAPQPTAGDDKRFTQAELDAIVEKRLARAKEKAEADRVKAEQQATEQALREQGEWQKLADQRAAELSAARAELDAAKDAASDRDRYKAAIVAQLKALRADLPPHITALLDKLDVADQLAYIAENHAALTKPAAPDINAGARGSGGFHVTEEDRRRVDAHYRHTL